MLVFLCQTAFWFSSEIPFPEHGQGNRIWTKVIICNDKEDKVGSHGLVMACYHIHFISSAQLFYFTWIIITTRELFSIMITFSCESTMIDQINDAPCSRRGKCYYWFVAMRQWSFRLKALFLFKQVRFPYFQKASNAELYPRNRSTFGVHVLVFYFY